MTIDLGESPVVIDGMDPVNVTFDAAGTWQGSYSADTTAQDFAKLGLLFLRGGE